MKSQSLINHTINTIDNIFFKKEIVKPSWLPKQHEYCASHGLDIYAPLNGICYCGAEIPDNGESLITSCKNCHRSFVD